MKTGKDGTTKLEHLKAAAKRVKVPELDYPEPDESVEYLLDHFYQLKQCKGQKISYSELKCYSDMMALNLQPFEVELIMTIDRMFERLIYG